jgi:hypothetical protein
MLVREILFGRLLEALLNLIGVGQVITILREVKQNQTV